jgi:HEAT repeat protein
MRLYTVAGSILLLALGFVLAGGAAPKKEEIPKYLKMLQTSKSTKDRALAADMIGRRGAININDVRDAIEPLKTTMQNDVDATVRKAAVTALGDIGTEPKETVPLLADVVKKDRSLEVKLAAVQALARFGSDAKPALPAIRELASKQKDNKKVVALLKLAQKAIVMKQK